MNTKDTIGYVSIDYFLATFKCLTFFTMLFVFFIHHSFLFLFFNVDKRLDFIMKSMKYYTIVGNKILNIKVKGVFNRENYPKGFLIVANHLSYIDFFVLFLYYPSLFITSVEIKNTFLLGQVSKMAGCFFVERRKQLLNEKIKKIELDKIKEKLTKGFNVFLFPEGTSSNGNNVLPFKAHFFQIAECGIPVLPICLKYRGKSGQIVPWYGSRKFFNHFFQICLLRNIEVEIVELPQVKSSDKFELSKKLHEKICEYYDKL